MRYRALFGLEGGFRPDVIQRRYRTRGLLVVSPRPALPALTLTAPPADRLSSTRGPVPYSSFVLAYPLTATFRIIALSPELQVRDANDQVILELKQKVFTLREDTTVFADEARTVPLYRMRADRISGFWATHHITRVSDGAPVGTVAAEGLRSLWSARYQVRDGQERKVFVIHEENPFIKFIDALVDDIPVIGWLLQSAINPTYVAEDENGVIRYRITKRRSLLERRFVMDRVAEDPHEDLDERLVALALIQVMLLERHRG
jgi:hypothetical protein